MRRTAAKEGISLNGLERYFSINREEDWRRGTVYNLESRTAGFGVRRDNKYGIAGTLQLSELDGTGTTREIAIGEHDRMYLLDERADLWIYDRRNADHKRLFTQGHGLFSADARLAASGDLLLVADRSGDRTLAAYHTDTGQTLWSRSGQQADGMPLYPIAIAADNRYVYVLTPLEIDDGGDEPAVPEGGKLGIMQFTLSGALTGVWSDLSFTQHVRAKLKHLNRTYFMSLSPSGKLYIFDTLFAKLFSFHSSGKLAARKELPSLPYAGLCIDSSGMLYIGDSRQMDQLSEDDRFIVMLDEAGHSIGKITSFRGKADQLLIDGKGRMFILNGDEGIVTMLNLQPQTLVMEETGVPEGVWLSRAYDSSEADTVWHKMTLDAFIPDGTQLRVSYFTLNEESCFINGTYRKVDDWLADTSLPYRDKLNALASYWSPPVINPKDSLFFGAKGRYLWLKIEWIGTERHSPLLQTVRLYFPRETFLSYLPSVYQEDPASRDFLERYLSLFGTLFSEVENEIVGLSDYLDPQLATGEHLRWLSSWLGLETDDYWTDEQVEAFIKAAPELYRYRGTRQGLMKTIEIYTGQSPLIIEYFQTKGMRDNAELRELTDKLYDGDPYTFTVLLRPEQAPSEKQRVVIEQLIEEQKPAYTEAKLVMLQPWMYLDLHTYLGINTVLTEPSLMSLNPNRTMPNDTLIVDVGMEKRMDIHTRLEMDSELE
ncbi:phage tail protein [Paenibacillus harenae]|uniref:Phage tail-like protein n=1 Tax=Paenibacillus harenae TaxID=306543 RepID=A0ABT9TVU3_PAEHA|nr:phage tail protein [Paenibacillus harenae]MDQ0110996.1 phage tail-like protein [Paenibacillus harenae]